MSRAQHKPRRLRWSRIARRAAGAGLGTLGLYALLLASRLLPAMPRAAARRRLMRAWGRLCLWAFAARLTVQGEPPRPPALLVSNHTSYLDVLAHAASGGPVLVSMAELVDWPVVGRLAESAGTIFLARERKRALLGVNDAIEAALAQGELVVFFPEGGSSDGSGVLPFRPSLLAPAARHGRPVHASSLVYRTQPPDPPAAACVPWFGGAPFLPHALALMSLRRVDVTLTFHPEPFQHADRKALAADLHRAVLEMHARGVDRPPTSPPSSEI